MEHPPTRCSGYGTTGVYWNGTAIQNLPEQHHSPPSAVYRTDFGTTRTGTLTIKTLNACGNRIDGLVTSCP